jgi:hypothetical protein
MAIFEQFNTQAWCVRSLRIVVYALAIKPVMRRNRIKCRAVSIASANGGAQTLRGRRIRIRVHKSAHAVLSWLFLSRTPGFDNVLIASV